MNAINIQNQEIQTRPALQRIYHRPMFRGTTKPREGSQRFDRLVLDQQAATDLGTDNVGLFVENCPSFERMVEHFQELNDFSGATWVVVASSKQVRDEFVRIDRSIGASIGSLQSPLIGSVVVATPEELPELSAAIENVAGILVHDYACHIHKCRGNGYRSFRAANDRPQKIVDFRMQFRIGQWSPPFLLFTNRKAISVNTLPMLSPYCLEAFRYIDGQTIRFGALSKPSTSIQLVTA